jgi:hypothetical protein
MTPASGHPLTANNFLLVADCVAPILWLIGAILLLKRTHLGYYMMSFYFFVTYVLARYPMRASLIPSERLSGDPTLASARFCRAEAACKLLATDTA